MQRIVIVKPRLGQTELNSSLVFKFCLIVHTFSVVNYFSEQKLIVMDWIAFPQMYMVKSQPPLLQNVTMERQNLQSRSEV